MDIYWMGCNEKINKIHKRLLRLLLNDCNDNFIMFFFLEEKTEEVMNKVFYLCKLTLTYIV